MLLQYVIANGSPYIMVNGTYIPAVYPVGVDTTNQLLTNINNNLGILQNISFALNIIQAIVIFIFLYLLFINRRKTR